MYTCHMTCINNALYALYLMPSFNESIRRTNDNNNNMNMNTNYSNNTVTNKIPIHVFWYNFRVICVIITYIIVVDNCSNDIFVFINRDFFMNILLSWLLPHINEFMYSGSFDGNGKTFFHYYNILYIWVLIHVCCILHNNMYT